ncbi:hypothetical protein PSAR109036_02620 [Psychrobacter arenosus]|uniref:hypothetical protein n=1 Tax=Psychrobacter arenosus TaxID=256326 RepID=UPI001918DB35|nr:hypothetical protein [Psychrobacter arenosus]
MLTESVIEIPGIILLIVCLLRSLQYRRQSSIEQIRAFWLASALIFIAVIRRELNFLPDLFIASDVLVLGHNYDWWEDATLLILYLLAVGLLIYSRRYLWAVLKNVSVMLYVSVATLALLQYMGENAIVFSQTIGGLIEEVAETIVYVIALVYLWQFKLSDFATSSVDQEDFTWSHTKH